MRRHTTDVAVIFCPIPRGIAASELTSWLVHGRSYDVPVTWTAPRDMLPMVKTATAQLPREACPAVAMDLSSEWPTMKQSLRHTLRSARAAWPALDAAVLHGTATLDHRDVLVQEGISSIGLDVFDASGRGSRRPAPSGWPCRSILWGLWEIRVSTPSRRGIVGRVADWWSRGRRIGRLSVLQAGRSSNAVSAAMLRTRLERHLAWASRRVQAGTLQAVTLSDLPAIIAGTSNSSLPGSVLRAA